jgi:hypothetical protein
MPTGADGKLAAACRSVGADAVPLPADPKLRALYSTPRPRRRVEALRLLKDSMPRRSTPASSKARHRPGV